MFTLIRESPCHAEHGLCLILSPPVARISRLGFAFFAVLLLVSVQQAVAQPKVGDRPDEQLDAEGESATITDREVFDAALGDFEKSGQSLEERIDTYLAGERGQLLERVDAYRRQLDRLVALTPPGVFERVPTARPSLDRARAEVDAVLRQIAATGEFDRVKVHVKGVSTRLAAAGRTLAEARDLADHLAREEARVVEEVGQLLAPALRRQVELVGVATAAEADGLDGADADAWRRFLNLRDAADESLDAALSARSLNDLRRHVAEYERRADALATAVEDVLAAQEATTHAREPDAAEKVLKLDGDYYRGDDAQFLTAAPALRGKSIRFDGTIKSLPRRVGADTPIYLVGDSGRFRVRVDWHGSDRAFQDHLRRLRGDRQHALTIFGTVSEMADAETAVVAVERYDRR